MHDFRLAARVVRKAPRVAFFSLALLAFGIGATTVTFSAFDALVLRPLAVRKPAELVRAVRKRPPLPIKSDFPYGYYRTLRSRSTTLSAVFGSFELETAVTFPSPVEPVRVHFVTPEYFDVLGASAVYGRTLAPADATQSAGDPPAVVSFDFWRRRFGGDPRVVGRALELDRVRFVVAGVMPRGFNGISTDTSPDIRVPFRTLTLFPGHNDPSKVDTTEIELAARLQPGATRARAQ